ncbi:MAG: NADH pyrophosphatase [Candidatus Anoxychlamydiales bacterium]|nr:NADH pyrophosphatase [Candidatus Anoxychlamydiales bacterium]
MTSKNTNIPASYLVLKKRRKILLLRRFNTGYEDGKYSMIAGHVDENESFSQAVIREACEEADIVIKKEDLQVIHIMHRFARESSKQELSQRIDVFFQTSKWEGKIKNVEKNKCDDLSWFDIDKMPLNIIPYIQNVIENIKKNIFFSEYGWKMNIKTHIESLLNFNIKTAADSDKDLLKDGFSIS